MSEIRLEKLRKEFKDVVAVKDISITFPSATVTCLLGPSGCGKTTLLRMIAGLEQPTSGEVYFAGQRVTHLPPRKRNIGMVFQYPVVYRGISVYRNIELPLLEEKISRQERQRRIDQVVALLGLEESLGKEVSQLDNGTRQKVAVARAVARQPRIILFDEPITNVDVNAKFQLKRAFKELSRELEQTILYVTHDQTEAMTLADQIALMKDGEIVQRDAPRELYNHPNDVFGGWFLGNPGMNFFQTELVDGPGGPQVRSPLFPGPLTVAGGQPGSQITLGIRPEHVQLSPEPTPQGVPGQILRRSIVVGGQYLCTVEVEGLRLKAKVAPSLGHGLRPGGSVWVTCPLTWIALFQPDGHRMNARLVGEGQGVMSNE